MRRNIEDQARNLSGEMGRGFDKETLVGNSNDRGGKENVYIERENSVSFRWSEGKAVKSIVCLI